MLLRPMLAEPGKHVPTGADWRHEVKWDGVRVLADVTDGGVRLTSRNGNDITASWPEVATSPFGARDLVVDGEVIALNERGVPDFRVLQERIHVRKATSVARLVERVPVTYFAFDLLRLDGRDITTLPLAERRAQLDALGLGDTTWQLSAQFDDGPTLHAATLEQGLEGIVSKRLDSRYLPGQRTRSWQKFAHRHRGSYVVGGWRPQEGTTDRLAALLVGEVTSSGLRYRGRVGSGIGGRQSRMLAELVAPLTRADSPFADEVPRVDARGSHWLEPRIVVDIDTHGLGYDRLRQPSFRGVRTDISPDDLVSTSSTIGQEPDQRPEPDHREEP